MKCPKHSNGELCEVHRSEDDLSIISFMCPLIATPRHCINPEHSDVDHKPKHCEDPGHIHEPEAKVVNFLTRLRHIGRNDEDSKEFEESEDEGFNEEIKVGWSYDPQKMS